MISTNKLILVLFISICFNVNFTEQYRRGGIKPSRICYLDFQQYFPQCYVSYAYSYWNEENIEICNYLIRCNGKIYENNIPIKDIKDLVLD